MQADHVKPIRKPMPTGEAAAPERATPAAIAVRGLHVRLGQAHILHGVDVRIMVRKLLRIRWSIKRP